MNGAEDWRVAKNTDGRPYYYIAGSTNTTWMKPDALLTPRQLQSGWGETTIANPLRTYWFRKEDKTNTTYEAPPEWQENLPEPP